MHGSGGKRAVVDAASPLWVLLGSEHLNSRDILDSQKASLCVLLLIKISHLVLQNHELYL